MNKIFLVTIQFLVILASCTSVGPNNTSDSQREHLTPTGSHSTSATLAPTSKPSLTITSTPNLFSSDIFELTISVRDENFHAHVYAVNVGCFDAIPCVIDSRKLFDMPSSVGGLSWSPNGQLLAFDSLGDHSYDVFVTPDEGNTITNITNSQEPDEKSPSWSPDGSQIAYSVQSSMEPSKILISSPDGTDTNQILTDVFEPFQFTWSGQGLMAYSAFFSPQDIRYQIRVLNKDGSLYWAVPLDESKTGSSAMDMTFSPNGESIIYSGNWLNNSRIYLASLKTKTTQALSSYDKDCNEFEASWLADENWIVFVSNCEEGLGSEYQPYLMDLTQMQKIKLDIGINANIDDVVWRPSK